MLLLNCALKLVEEIIIYIYIFLAFEDVSRLRRLTDLHLTAEAQARSQSSARNIYGGHSCVGKGFCRNFVLLLVSIIPPTLHIHLHLMLLKSEGQNGEE